MTLLSEIQKLQTVNTLTKHEHLVNGVLNAIDSGILKNGDKLPSINQMVADLGYARKTIVKAYEDLKGRGLVESKNFKGYYIASEETKNILKVAVLLYAFHSFQEDFYNTLRESLGDKYHLDVFFHHNNREIFKTIIGNIKKKYGMCVVAPIQFQNIEKSLKKIPSDKLILVDRYVDLGEEYGFITQEFEKTTLSILEELLQSFKKYKEIILFFKEDSDFPLGIKTGFKKFLKKHKLKGKIVKNYQKDSVKKSTAYIFISDKYLWDLLYDCKLNNFEIGKDVGVLSHNNIRLKELIFGGISTISVDFKLMANLAAQSIINKRMNQLIIPTELINRGSL